jgi:hypothetical protein
MRAPTTGSRPAAAPTLSLGLMSERDTPEPDEEVPRINGLAAAISDRPRSLFSRTSTFGSPGNASIPVRNQAVDDLASSGAEEATSTVPLGDLRELVLGDHTLHLHEKRRLRIVLQGSTRTPLAWLWPPVTPMTAGSSSTPGTGNRSR